MTNQNKKPASKEEASETTDNNNTKNPMLVTVGSWFFKMRDYTPIPLILMALIFQTSTVRSATFGVICTIFGELVRIYSVAFIGKVSRTRNTSSMGAQLIQEGPFAWVRNPLYVGNFFIAIGISIFSGLVWLVILTGVLFAIQYYFIVNYEEEHLNTTFGDTYHQYCQKVPAWFPKKIDPVRQWQWPDTFSEALISEKRTLTSIFSIVVILMLLA